MQVAIIFLAIVKILFIKYHTFKNSFKKINVIPSVIFPKNLTF